MTYFLVRGRGMQVLITRLQCSCRAICASSWGGNSTSGGGQACRYALNNEGWSSGGHCWFRQYVKPRWILCMDSVTTVRHPLPWCWHHSTFYICPDPARGIACQEGHNLQVCSFNTYTKSRHAAWDDVGRNTLGNLQVMLLIPVCKTGSSHLHREHCNARCGHWELV